MLDWSIEEMKMVTNNCFSFDFLCHYIANSKAAKAYFVELPILVVVLNVGRFVRLK